MAAITICSDFGAPKNKIHCLWSASIFSILFLEELHIILFYNIDIKSWGQLGYGISKSPAVIDCCGWTDSY